ncbi:hypothetical protein [Paraburkholderia xenovorans]
MLRQSAHRIKSAEMGANTTKPEKRDDDALAVILDALLGGDKIRDPA